MNDFMYIGNERMLPKDGLNTWQLGLMMGYQYHMI